MTGPGGYHVLSDENCRGRDMKCTRQRRLTPGAAMVSWWNSLMGRVIAVMACGFFVAACSTPMPILNFISSSPPTESLRFESNPPDAEVTTSSGQTCRTPCELSVQVAAEFSATFALGGYQPETVLVRSETSPGFSSPRLAPNPVHVELQPVLVFPVVPPPTQQKKRIKKKPAVATVPAISPAASAPPA